MKGSKRLQDTTPITPITQPSDPHRSPNHPHFPPGTRRCLVVSSAPSLSLLPSAPELGVSGQRQAPTHLPINTGINKRKRQNTNPHKPTHRNSPNKPTKSLAYKARRHRAPRQVGIFLGLPSILSPPPPRSSTTSSVCTIVLFPLVFAR